jgi:hypothetical protein
LLVFLGDGLSFAWSVAANAAVSFGFSPIALLSRLLLPRSIVALSRGVFPFLYLMSISSSCQGG